MNTYLKWLIPSAIVAAVAVWYYMQDNPVTRPIEPTEQTATADLPAKTPAPKYPLAEQDDTAQPPALDDSDETVMASLQALLGTPDLSSILFPTEIIRHIVATVDNLPKQKLAVPLRPLRATPGKFLVTDPEDSRMLSAENFDRYAAVMALVKMTDIKQCANWYRRHYTLFQQTYQRLGYPDGYFNDRLVQAIDDLLDTPELDQPIYLTRRKVFYEFADPALESRSAGQKTLLRMGPSNIKILKEKLTQFRAEIIKPTL